MKRLQGMMKFKDIGMGCWTLLTKEKEQFEIIGGDDSLYKDGKKAILTGKIRDDLMSTGNIGPIFEVDSIEAEEA